MTIKLKAQAVKAVAAADPNHRPTDFAKYLIDTDAFSYQPWAYRFPNGYTASVIVDPRPGNPFRFEVLSDDPGDAGQGGVVTDLTSQEVEAKLATVLALPPVTSDLPR